MFALAIDNAIPGSKYWNRRLKVEYKSLKKSNKLKCLKQQGHQRLKLTC